MRGNEGRTLDQLVNEQLKDYAATLSNEYPLANASLGAPDGYTLLTQLVGAAGASNVGLTVGPGFYDLPGEKSIADMLVEWDHENNIGRHAASGRMRKGELFVGNDFAIADPIHVNQSYLR